MLKPLLMIAWRETQTLRYAFVIGVCALALIAVVGPYYSPTGGRLFPNQSAFLWIRAACLLLSILFLLAEGKTDASLRFPRRYLRLPLATGTLACAVFAVRVTLYTVFAAAFAYVGNRILAPALQAQIKHDTLFAWLYVSSPLALVGYFALALGLCWLPRWAGVAAGAGLVTALSLGLPLPPVAAMGLGLALAVWGVFWTRRNPELDARRGGGEWLRFGGRRRPFESAFEAQRWFEVQRVLRGAGAMWLYVLPMIPLLGAAALLIVFRPTSKQDILLPLMFGVNISAVGAAYFSPLAIFGPFREGGRATRRFAMLRPSSDWALTRARIEASLLLWIGCIPLACAVGFLFLTPSFSSGGTDHTFLGDIAVATKYISLDGIAVACVVSWALLWASGWGAAHLAVVALLTGALMEALCPGAMLLGSVGACAATLLALYALAHRRGVMSPQAKTALCAAAVLAVVLATIAYAAGASGEEISAPWPHIFLGLWFIAPFIIAPLETHLRRHL